MGSSGDPVIDLHHHGDREIGGGLVDLAVNVRLPAPPDWLAAVIAESITTLGCYPRIDEARAAVAARHGVREEQVLPTAGGAEAFTLLARGLSPRHALIVHPQFTEPDAALRAAGVDPDHLLLTAGIDFTLDPTAVDDEADLVIVGNPTNPTSVLHPAATLARLRRPGRVVVVDEAFLDAVPGEVDTMINSELSGVLVLRSLTKTWGLAGLRAGYVVGDPALVRLLAAQQPPWSVSSPAAAAMVACMGQQAQSESTAAALAYETKRAHLITRLVALGLPPVTPARAPFVLADTSAVARHPGSVREELRTAGFAVRRGDTFPGLGPDWIRIAVRDTSVSDALADALADVINR
ncbi:Rv2231c family pyridoxal phosphate-dependent protein CobC [Propionibacteriaceae bacterium Y1685]